MIIIIFLSASVRVTPNILLYSCFLFVRALHSKIRDDYIEPVPCPLFGCAESAQFSNPRVFRVYCLYTPTIAMSKYLVTARLQSRYYTEAATYI